jgi:hypothetical protein
MPPPEAPEAHENTNTPTILRHAVAGGLAGAFNDLVMHPADTIRARINLASSESRIASPLGAFINEFRSIVQTQGFRGLYRGYTSVLLFSMPGNGIYFSSYEYTKSKLQPTLNTLSEPLAGLFAQFAVSALWTPSDIVKQRMQTQDLVASSSSRTSTSFRNEFQILLKSGELYRGLVASWIVWSPFSIVYFGVFESTRRILTKTFHSPNDWRTDLMSGSMAGIAGAIISQPADAVKTRLQVLRGDDFMVGGFWKGCRDIVRKEGSGSLWRGVVARVCWLAPGTALTITAFEAMKGLGYKESPL